MTVPGTSNKMTHTGDGIQTVFPYTYRVDSAGDMVVYVDDVVVPASGNWSISGVGDPSGGNVTFLVAPLSGLSVTLIREVPINQLTDYTPYDKFPAETHEQALDKLTFICQQVLELSQRAIQLPPSSTIDPRIPNPVPEAILQWDVAGVTLENGPTVNVIQTWRDESQAAAAAAAVSETNAAQLVVDCQAEVVNCQTEVSNAAAQVVLATAWAEAAVGATPPGPTSGSAKAWAETAHNVLVDGVGYSALHHATEAAAQVVLAAAWAEAAAGANPPGTTNGSAKAWAETAEDVEVIAGSYSAYHWAKKAEAAAASGLYKESEHIATQGQTVFTHTSEVTNEQISLNGAILAAADYSITSTTQITLTVGAALNDVIRIQTIGLIAVNTYLPLNPTTPGDDMTGLLILSGDPTDDLGATTKQYVDGLFDAKTNFIINGGFDIAQRGTSFAAVATSTYTLDRWAYQKSGTMVHNAGQSGLYPANVGVRKSIFVNCATADTSIASTDYTIIAYTVEGYDFAKIAGRNARLSFWVRATKIGTYCIAFRNSGIDRTYVVEYTVNVTDTWEHKSVVIPFTETGGTWNYTNGRGIMITWALACGSTYQTTADAWQTGNYLSTSNQVNACDSTSNEFRLAGVQLNTLEYEPEFFPHRLISEEMALCQRYFSSASLYHRFRARASGAFAGTAIYLPQAMRGGVTVTPGAIYYSNNITGSVTPTMLDQLSCRFAIQATTDNLDTYIGQIFTFDSEL